MLLFGWEQIRVWAWRKRMKVLNNPLMFFTICDAILNNLIMEKTLCDSISEITGTLGVPRHVSSIIVM
jgi:hypothetical protein